MVIKSLNNREKDEEEGIGFLEGRGRVLSQVFFLLIRRFVIEFFNKYMICG